MYGGTGAAEAVAAAQPADAACECRIAADVAARPGLAGVPGLSGMPGMPVQSRHVRHAVPRLRGLRHDRAHSAESLTDGELVTLALNGAAPAFSHLLERHARHVRRLVARRLRDPDDILDVIQDTRLAVWRALHHYDARRPFEAWLTSIALNKCRDWARRQTAQLGMRMRLEADVAQTVAGAGTSDPERQLAEEERVRRLGQALERLPSQLRAPLVLTALQERSQTTAARELGLTRKAIEMRVRRARQHLQQALLDGCAAR